MKDDVALVKETEPPSQGAGNTSSTISTEETTASDEVPLSGLVVEAADLPKARTDSGPTLSRPARPRPEMRTGRRMREFRLAHFPKATAEEWNDWQWQIKNRIKDVKTLNRIVRLSDDELKGLALHKGVLPVSITPYYAGLLDPFDASSPVRRTVIPVGAEHVVSPGESCDPLGEDSMSPVPGLVHRYPDRVLFLVTGMCASYCRYCTRSRMVGRRGGFSVGQWEQALEYIGKTPTVRDVLLSGGDPLTLPDEKLEWLLKGLRKIRHVEIVRIGTKAPVVLPQRVTPALTRMLRRYHPLFMSIHFTHPDELTTETVQACRRLADAGIPLGSQTVLLKGVNDDVDTMKRLVHGLLTARVRPYYLYQCDPNMGTAHFRTPVSKGLEIIRGLRGHTSGYAVPTYVIDAPGGGGKIPLLPDYVTGRDGDWLVLENYEGKAFRYPDHAGAEAGREVAVL